MWAPLRIDHHGWQLAMLSLAMAALTDPKRARGGALLGIATALSLVIGLEMLLYLALAGGIVVLMWVRDAAEGRRLATYGASLAGGCALGFLLFASYANRAPVCDALSPVWLSVVAAGGAIAVGLALPGAAILAASARPRRGAAGAALARGLRSLPGRIASAGSRASRRSWMRLWLGNVREARPLYRHGYSTAIAVAALPVTGLIGYAIMLWRSRRDGSQLIAWAATGALRPCSPRPAAAVAEPRRTGGAAARRAGRGRAGLADPHRRQPLHAGPGGRHRRRSSCSSRASFPSRSLRCFPPNAEARDQGRQQGQWPLPDPVRRCKPVALVPRGQVLTFVDLGPRLIAVTHHDAVAGPYHRNGRDIVDVMRTFRGTRRGRPRDDRAAADRLCADLPRPFGIDHLREPGEGRLLHAARPGPGPGLAPAGAAARPIRPTGCGGSVSHAGTLDLKLTVIPSITNWAASAARMTPSKRVSIASIRWPSRRISQPAASSETQGQDQDRGQRGEHDQAFVEAVALAPSAA